MAKFEKGNKAGKGRAKGTQVVPKTLKELNRKEIERVLKKYLAMDRGEVERIAKSKDTLALDAMVANIVERSISAGDHTRLNFLLDRLIGKVKESMDLNVTMTPHQEILNRIKEAKDSEEN